MFLKITPTITRFLTWNNLVIRCGIIHTKIHSGTWIHELQEPKMSQNNWKITGYFSVKLMMGWALVTKKYSHVVRRITQERTKGPLEFRKHLVRMGFCDFPKVSNVYCTWIEQFNCQYSHGLLRIIVKDCEFIWIWTVKNIISWFRASYSDAASDPLLHIPQFSLNCDFPNRYKYESVHQSGNMKGYRTNCRTRLFPSNR